MDEAVERCGRLRTALQVCALASLKCLAPNAAKAQSAPPFGSGAVGPATVLAAKPTLSLGGSILEFDYAGDDAFRGIAVRGGVALGSLAELTVSGERWPDLRPYDGGWALQAEASVYPLGRRRLAPYVLLHFGHFRATLPPGTTYTGPVLSGRTTGLALGLHARVLDPLGIRLEGLVRFDVGGGDDQLRVLLTYAPGVGDLPPPAARVAAVTYGMVPVSGPWRFVDPAYALKFATAVTDRDAAALTVALVHWQIPGSSRLLAPYLWDTGAVLVMPGWRRGSGAQSLQWYVQAGPGMTLMVEGPDYGLRAGAHAEVGGSVRLGHLPGITAGVGWLWIIRGVSDPSLSATDERGLLVHAGITF